ncbi:hypothetical protein [Oxynema aestuarii]|uniref:NACHT domain-containing protein n=1 Tax=Oxynema aestuarii AP17 TaxID=2064643 RepID=A0A6H1TZ74_9CYAN|nr:hypothetical protein [Oxynema aestuarii]QIZ71902.1 hypothetical protein HCG48_16020 [Oxynema aestuarii AP17]
MPKIRPTSVCLLTILFNGLVTIAIVRQLGDFPDLSVVIALLSICFAVIFGSIEKLPGASELNWFWSAPLVPFFVNLVIYAYLTIAPLDLNSTQTSIYLSLLLFFLGTGLPAIAIVVRRWSAWKHATISDKSQLLAAVEREIESRWQQSLHHAVFSHLAIDRSTPTARRLWDVELKLGKKAREKLDKQADLLDVFKDRKIPGKLLILGGLGSGKTTTLLQLGKSLSEKAQSDARSPLPVLVELTRWQRGANAIDWLAETIAKKYKINREKVKFWLNNGAIVPLLDGLEQLDLANQEDCIDAINQARKADGKPLPLIVCHRMDLYQKCERRLRLRGAIGLRLLKIDQIEDYLLNSRSRELWENIKDSPELLALAKKPLLLNVMTLAYEEILIHSWKRLTCFDDRSEYVLNAFIRRQSVNPDRSHWYPKGKEPTPQQTRQWLKWLGETLVKRRESEFAIEEIPPILLHSPASNTLYPIALLLLLALAYTLIFALLYGSDRTQTYLPLFAIASIVFILTMAPYSKKIQLAPIADKNLWLWSIAPVICALIGWLSLRVSELVWFAIQNAENPAMFSGILRASKLLPVLGLVVTLAAALPGIKHLSLRLILWRKGDIPWNLKRFLNYATERLFLQKIGDRYRFVHELFQEHFINSRP